MNSDPSYKYTFGTNPDFISLQLNPKAIHVHGLNMYNIQPFYSQIFNYSIKTLHKKPLNFDDSQTIHNLKHLTSLYLVEQKINNKKTESFIIILTKKNIKKH